MNTRILHPLSAPALLCSLAAAGLAPSAATAQVTLAGPPQYFGSVGGMSLLPGYNLQVGTDTTPGSLTGHFRGDLVASLEGTNAPGATFLGSALQYAIIPFTVGALPVRVGEATMHANFKLVASGGNGIADGNDPVVTAFVQGRLYQQLGTSANPAGDPWLSAIDLNRTYTQNGNGLQVIDATFGPATSNYILTPGTYYLFEYLLVTTRYTSNGVIQPRRGVAVEFGGDLSSGYSGFDYTFTWQTVPAPSSLGALTLAGVMAMRRRRAH